MKYNVIAQDTKPVWDTVEAVEVMQYTWSDVYMPYTTAKLVREEGKGFWLHMTCEETLPKAVYTQDNDPVYKDSCMEFFVNFYPEEDGTGYVNFEMNSNGAILCEYGQPGERFYVKERGMNYPKPVVTKQENTWAIELFIADEFIKEVYGKAEFVTGHVAKGNFYKCGDETHTAHYGSWSPITNPVPAFHKPEFFGELIIQ